MERIYTDCGHINRKCQDYVYVKWEYWNTMCKIKHYLRHENKVNENKVLSYCDASRSQTIKKKKKLSCVEKAAYLQDIYINILPFCPLFHKKSLYSDKDYHIQHTEEVVLILGISV